MKTSSKSYIWWTSPTPPLDEDSVLTEAMAIEKKLEAEQEAQQFELQAEH